MDSHIVHWCRWRHDEEETNLDAIDDCDCENATTINTRTKTTTTTTTKQ